jgi:FkbM family methyltransferase
MNFIVAGIMKSKYYNFLRYSPLPNAIVELQTGKTRKNIEFYSSFLPVARLKGAVVFDVGANKGNKTKAFLDMGCKVVCVEPEQKCLGTLHYRFDRNPSVKIINKGLSDKEGKMTLHIQEFRSGYNTLSDKWADSLVNSADERKENTARFIDEYEVDITTLDQVIRQEGKPFYIKIDVEGLELAVLKGLSTPVPFISFEANLPEFKTETLEIVALMHTLSGGKTVYKLAAHDKIMQDKWLSNEEISAVIAHTAKDGAELICYTESAL